MGWVEIGVPDRAERLARHVLSLIDVRRLLEIRCVTHIALGRAAILQGRFPEGVRALDDAAADLADADNPHIRLEIALGRHYLAVAAGRPEEADRYLREAERRAERIRARMDDAVIRDVFSTSSWIVSRIRTARAALGSQRGAPATPSEG
jgi:hypothetical protein